jgi:4-amino-4-deoxy-L-arabinose transferase-like glycosyltransferase
MDIPFVLPRRWWGFILIILLSFALRISIVSHGLPFIAHVDEPNFYILSGIERGALTENWRTNWLAGYPPAYIWLYAQVSNGLDTIHPLNPHTQMGVYVATMRIVSVLADTITLALVMTLARMLGGSGSALLAGLTYTLTAQIIFNTGLALADATMTMFVMLCVVLSQRAWARHDTRLVLLATVAGLAAVLFKYSVFLVLLAPAIYFLRLLWQRRQRALLPSALALLLVLGTAYWLLFIYGANNLNNVEAEAVRSAPLANLLSPAQWRLTWLGLYQMLNLPMLIIMGIGLCLFFVQGRFRASWLVWLTTLGIFATIPVFLAIKTPVRYLWSVVALLLPVGYSAWLQWKSPHKRQIIFLVLTAIILLWGIPQTAQIIQQINRPYTYTQLQLWAAANLDPDAVLYVESNLILRTIARYETGFPGYQNFEVVYADNVPDWQVAADEVDYILTHGGRKTFWDTQPVALMKAIDNPAMQGMPLYIYVNEVMQPQPIAQFSDSATSIALRDLDVTQESNRVTIDTYWQAVSPVTRDYSYTVYITPQHEPTTVLAQQDAELGSRPSSTWVVDELLSGNISPFALPDNLPAGDYSIWFAVYYWETLERMTHEDGTTTLHIIDITVGT